MSACGLIVFYLIFAWFWGVWPFNGEDIRPMQHGQGYDVYFYHPDKREEQLGRVEGLDACAGKAYLWAKDKNLIDSNEWRFKCCLNRKGLKCYEKE
jgi:hypothetical protein